MKKPSTKGGKVIASNDTEKPESKGVLVFHPLAKGKRPNWSMASAERRRKSKRKLPERRRGKRMRKKRKAARKKRNEEREKKLRRKRPKRAHDAGEEVCMEMDDREEVFCRLRMTQRALLWTR